MKSLLRRASPTIPIDAPDGYRLWSRTYDRDPNPILALESRILCARLDALSGEVFVDVGCGTGRWMAYAAKRFPTVLGVDSCAEMLHVARGKALPGGALAQADCRALPFRAAVADIAVCSFTIAYVSDAYVALRELARITRPGGILFLTEFHPETGRRGWRRTFRVGQLVYELETHPVDREQLLELGQLSGLRLRNICEPRLGEPEAVLMQNAGKGELFREISAIPAILCIEWERM